MDTNHPNYSFAKSKEEVVAESIPNLLPRAVLRHSS
jgi:hypothetical protein